MPSTIASHIYTMVALAVISTLLVATVNSYATTLRATTEETRFRNVLTHVASEATKLIITVTATNSSTRVFVQLSETIGVKQYWLRVCNDSVKAWLEGSLGEMTSRTGSYSASLPNGISARGHFVSGYGAAILESYMNGSVPQLNLAFQGV